MQPTPRGFFRFVQKRNKSQRRTQGYGAGGHGLWFAALKCAKKRRTPTPVCGGSRISVKWVGQISPLRPYWSLDLQTVINC